MTGCRLPDQREFNSGSPSPTVYTEPVTTSVAPYDELLASATALLDGETDLVAAMANLSSLVYHSLPELNWVGFYVTKGGELVVGPFQGKPACTPISFDRGVCGAAARTQEIQRVDDVHAVPDHIACDADSRSELVIPLVQDGKTVGVLDLDSPRIARFDETDQAGLAAVAALILNLF